ncbi:MAG: hypothetical protein M0Q23_09585 [Syntrophales bacterium]|jgi:hypothetical protein|nr:hypothetical protein [Syntrophales bacterium]MCK9528865.1 hypothetical protein [Syntrophales bacterium]MDX9921161.1 hypothetical protein [Syntrophales bacterium]
MNKKILVFVAAFFCIFCLPPLQATGQPPIPPHGKFPGKHHPYGDYIPKRHRDYGATRLVENEEQARKILEEYFGDLDVSIGSLERKRGFFRAEIFDASGDRIDIIIIDRRTGRIRSIF